MTQEHLDLKVTQVSLGYQVLLALWDHQDMRGQRDRKEVLGIMVQRDPKD